ncbi:MAG: hypothetical protein ACR2M8_09185 [Pyrinomonadaceae bacterium]|nr:hypothetical protein [Blastocatellia bacterium]MDQ3489650.1 hypothetical protein [Acidobacteriota bacterium]
MPLPELARKNPQFEELFNGRKRKWRQFFVGDGFITLVRTRGENDSTILVRTRIYPDKALKLD